MKTEEIAGFRQSLIRHGIISGSGCEYLLDSYELQRECIAELVEALNKASHGLGAAGYGRQRYIEDALARAKELLK